MSVQAAGELSLNPDLDAGPDRGLLQVAQRAAAASVALAPTSELARDELGGVFGLKGHGYTAYGLPFAGSDRAGEAGDDVGNVPFRAAFSVNPGGTVVTGLGRGGRASVFQWWSIAEVAWGRAVLLLVDPGSQAVSERDEVSVAAAVEHPDMCHSHLVNLSCSCCRFAAWP